MKAKPKEKQTVSAEKTTGQKRKHTKQVSEVDDQGSKKAAKSGTYCDHQMSAAAVHKNVQFSEEANDKKSSSCQQCVVRVTVDEQPALLP